MKLKNLAQRVFDAYSKPLKSCWLLKNPADFDCIYYAPGTECFLTAQEIAAQISVRYKHPVELHTFQYIETHGVSDFYPEDFSMCDIEISAEMLKTLSRPKILVVCYAWLKRRLQELEKTENVRLNIFTPDLFYLRFCYETDADIEFGAIAESRIIKPVSNIIVWAEEPEIWGYAFQLFEYHRRAYPDKNVRIALVADTPNRRYNGSAIRNFLSLCDEYKADSGIVSSLSKADVNESCLLVYSQRKSYLADRFKHALYYVINEQMPFLWWWYNGMSRSMLLEDIREIAFCALLYDSNTSVAEEFLEKYKAVHYPRWRQKLYWWSRRMTMFRWSIV